MRKSAKLRAVYFELRRVAGAQVPAGDLIRLAHFILRAYTVTDEDFDDFGRPAASRAFFALPLDRAMEDGGWRVLDFEAHRSFDIDALDPQDIILQNVHIQNLLGPIWQQQMRED